MMNVSIIKIVNSSHNSKGGAEMNRKEEPQATSKSSERHAYNSSHPIYALANTPHNHVRRTMIAWCVLCKRFAFRKDLVCDACVAEIKPTYQKVEFHIVMRTIEIPQPKNFVPCIIIFGW